MMLSIAQALNKLLKVFSPEFEVLYDGTLEGQSEIPIPLPRVPVRLRLIIKLSRSMSPPVAVYGKRNGEWKSISFFPGYPTTEQDATKIVFMYEELQVKLMNMSSDPVDVLLTAVYYETF